MACHIRMIIFPFSMEQKVTSLIGGIIQDRNEQNAFITKNKDCIMKQKQATSEK